MVSARLHRHPVYIYSVRRIMCLKKTINRSRWAELKRHIPFWNAPRKIRDINLKNRRMRVARSACRHHVSESPFTTTFPLTATPRAVIMLQWDCLRRCALLAHALANLFKLISRILRGAFQNGMWPFS